MFDFTVHGDQWIGARSRQEDSFSIVTGKDATIGPWLSLIVADGMGGHAAGDVASSMVTEVFEEALCSAPVLDPNLLTRSLSRANQKIKAVMDQYPETTGMGTTLVATLISEQRFDWVSVGDSAMYLLRNRVLRRLNADHSMAGALDQMVASGRMTKEEADSEPNRHILRSSISGDQIDLVDTATKEHFLQEGDTLILASDGLEVLPELDIANIVTKYHSEGAHAIVAALLEKVRDMSLPNQDNITIVVLTLTAPQQVAGVWNKVLEIFK